MKIKYLAHTASVCVIMLFAATLPFYEALARAEGSPPTNRQHQIAAQDGIASVSSSKGTVLILLAVGIIGVLSVRRKKKAPNSLDQSTVLQAANRDRHKVFIDLNKQYLSLQYKIARHKFSGDTPPDGLLKEISDIERKVRLISRALQ